MRLLSEMYRVRNGLSVIKVG